MSSNLAKTRVKTWLALGSLLAVTTVGLSTSESSGVFAADDLTAFQNAMLARHNYWRAKHGVPPLKLDAQLNSNAQAWANTLASTQQFQHAGVKDQGENLYLSASTSTTLPAITTEANNAVDSWYNEIGKYDYNSPVFSSATGHFTQVVWKSTTTLGCGIASGKYQTYNGRYVVCRYTPPGNYTGAFSGNVLKLK